MLRGLAAELPPKSPFTETAVLVVFFAGPPVLQQHKPTKTEQNIYFKGREGPKKVLPGRLQSGQPYVTERQDPPLQARLPCLQGGRNHSMPLDGHLTNSSPFPV